jgi:hypothetical protein
MTQGFARGLLGCFPARGACVAAAILRIGIHPNKSKYYANPAA